MTPVLFEPLEDGADRFFGNVSEERSLNDLLDRKDLRALWE
jgi:hypothetical protein